MYYKALVFANRLRNTVLFGFVLGLIFYFMLHEHRLLGFFSGFVLRDYFDMWRESVNVKFFYGENRKTDIVWEQWKFVEISKKEFWIKDKIVSTIRQVLFDNYVYLVIDNPELTLDQNEALVRNSINAKISKR